ncbi:MAG: PQQ-binding-like beta-propeller repeat protein [Pyrinomonadaceae bacterium]
MRYFRESALNYKFALFCSINIISKTFLAILFLSIFSGVVLATDEKPSEPQLKLCWQFPNSELTGILPTTQSDHIFLTATGGKLFALNLSNGATLWRTELGGEIVGQTQVNQNLVFAASQISATNDKPAFIIIRALSAETGLTVWQGELPAASQIALALHENYLLAATGELNGVDKIFALSAQTGELRWTQKQTAQLSTSLTIARGSLVFATNDKILHVLSIADGHESHHFSLPHPATEKIVFNNGVFLFGDQAGNVSAIRETDGKTSWELRLGGAAQNILTVSNGVVISSLDDFVYFHNISNGRRIWRKRLASRPVGAVLLSKEAVLLAATGETNSVVLSLKKGKLLSQIPLGGDNVAVASPFAANSFVFVPTSQGLLSFAPVSASCPTK